MSLPPEWWETLLQSGTSIIFSFTFSLVEFSLLFLFFFSFYCRKMYEFLLLSNLQHFMCHIITLIFLFSYNIEWDEDNLDNWIECKMKVILPRIFVPSFLFQSFFWQSQKKNHKFQNSNQALIGLLSFIVAVLLILYHDKPEMKKRKKINIQFYGILKPLLHKLSYAIDMKIIRWV